MLVIATNDNKGILAVVDIIDADVPHALAMFLLLAEVHAEVEAVIHLLTHVHDKQQAKKNIKPVFDMLVKSFMEYVLEDEG